MLQKLYEENKEHFSKSDYKIMDCLMKNQRDLQYLTTADLVNSVGVSSSTISRFWEKIGFQNIKEFKQQMRMAEHSSPSVRTSSALKRWQAEESHIKNIGRQYRNHIMNTLERLKPEMLEHAAQEILNAKRIYLFATDASVGLADILIYRCRRLGIEFIPIASGSGIYESMVNLGSRDLILMFSYSRILSEIQILLKHARNIHCKTILFTDLFAAPETAWADMVFYSYRGEPNEYHSMAAPLALIDLMIMKLTEKKADAVERAAYLEKLREEYAGLIKR